MHLTCRKTIFLEWKTNISREGPPQAFLNPYFTQQFYCHNHLKRKFLKAISNEHHTKDEPHLVLHFLHTIPLPLPTPLVQSSAAYSIDSKPSPVTLLLGENRHDLQSAERRELVLYFSAPPTIGIATPAFAVLWKLGWYVCPRTPST